MLRSNNTNNLDVVERLSNQIANVLESAAAAEQRASDAMDPVIRADYERLARGWRWSPPISS
jgi:hypothetical protein